jgi:hypothetical protein
MTSTLLVNVLDVGGIVGFWKFAVDTFSIDNFASFGRKPKAERKDRLSP